jgi:2-pyrone-4,6-dicarboxylate lactonase
MNSRVPLGSYPVQLNQTLPVGACDAHCHVFGSVARVPYALDRAYTSPNASYERVVTLSDFPDAIFGLIARPNIQGRTERRRTGRSAISLLPGHAVPREATHD